MTQFTDRDKEMLVKHETLIPVISDDVKEMKEMLASHIRDQNKQFAQQQKQQSELEERFATTGFVKGVKSSLDKLELKVDAMPSQNKKLFAGIWIERIVYGAIGVAIGIVFYLNLHNNG